jgi:hypothetical protein
MSMLKEFYYKYVLEVKGITEYKSCVVLLEHYMYSDQSMKLSVGSAGSNIIDRSDVKPSAIPYAKMYIENLLPCVERGERDVDWLIVMLKELL